jgi:hypothetical protein
MSGDAHVRFWESAGSQVPHDPHLPVYRQQDVVASYRGVAEIATAGLRVVVTRQGTGWLWSPRTPRFQYEPTGPMRNGIQGASPAAVTADRCSRIWPFW